MKDILKDNASLLVLMFLAVNLMKHGRWSSKYNCCLSCQRNDRNHGAKGLCVACYSRQHRSSIPVETSREKHREKWNKQSFDGNREVALQRDGYRCTLCETENHLVVHHIDGNGRTSKKPNNDLGNLQTLCRACHMKLHGTIRRTQKWSQKYDFCQSCETTEVKHYGHGLCEDCRRKRKKKV